MKAAVYFYYHLTCHYIDDNTGDIKLVLMKSSQDTVAAC